MRKEALSWERHRPRWLGKGAMRVGVLAKRACRVGILPRLLGCWLLLLLAAGSAMGQDDGRASAPSGEQVERWLATLRAFEVPQPGPISSETARLKSEILRAPLEQMPPPVRAGYILAQTDILANDGDWQGFTALRRRITNSESWDYAQEDNWPLRQVAAYYDHKPFAPPGGWRPDDFDSSMASHSDAYWDSHYRNRDEYIAILEYTCEHSEHTDGMAAVMGYLLAEELLRQGQEGRSGEILAELGAIPLNEFTAAAIYDDRGRWIEAERLRQRNANSIELHRRRISTKSSSGIEEEARPRHEESEHRREPEEGIPAGTDPLAFTVPPSTGSGPSGTLAEAWREVRPLPNEPAAVPAPVPAGGRTRLWLLLGVVLAVGAAAAAGVLLARRAGAKR